MLTTRSQRWRERRARYVDDLSVITPSRFSVATIKAHTAPAFIERHHYLPRYPAAQLAVGLFGPGPGKTSALVGVAVFAVPSTNAVITRHTGLAAASGTMLARFILTDDVAGNGETFFLSRALRCLCAEKPGIEAIVSYSDPTAGHIGQIYAAMSSAYRGQMPARTGYRVGDTPISGRTLSKIRLGERGASGAVDQLVTAGAPRPMISEPLPVWLDRLSRTHVLLRAKHPGLHAYAFAITRRARRIGAKLPTRPYPKVLVLPVPKLPLFTAGYGNTDRNDL